MTDDKKSREGLVSITIENSDLSAMIAEYAQENAQLRLTVKALIRKINTLQIELAAIKKPDEKEKADAVQRPQEGQ